MYGRSGRERRTVKGREAVLLADEFFLLGLDDRTGRARLGRRVYGLGVAAALLGELTASRNVAVQGYRLVVVDRTPPVDALAHTTLDHLVAEPGVHAVRDWLVFLSASAPDSVAQRLWRAGHLHRAVSRRLLFRRSETLWLPVDVNVAAWPLARLSMHLQRGERLGWADQFLGGLAAATGLDRQILDGAPRHARDYLYGLVGNELWAPLRVLGAQAQAAVGDTVLTSH